MHVDRPPRPAAGRLGPARVATPTGGGARARAPRPRPAPRAGGGAPGPERRIRNIPIHHGVHAHVTPQAHPVRMLVTHTREVPPTPAHTTRKEECD
jgi:hypothetical protein